MRTTSAAMRPHPCDDVSMHRRCIEDGAHRDASSIEDQGKLAMRRRRCHSQSDIHEVTPDPVL
eukprot:3616399-Pyramimonas_sp.AAC.1